MTPDQRIEQTDAIREQYADWWRNEEAQQKLRQLWGDAINAYGVFVSAAEEVLYDRDGCTAEISIAAAGGMYGFGYRFMTPTQGSGSAPSIWGEFFPCYAQARIAAIDCLLKRLPKHFYLHEEGQRHRIEQMRNVLTGIVAQPSLF
jgi:hypothetical protein